MPHNVEIKARVIDPDSFLAVAVALADKPAEIILQKDIFYTIATGRLKLRDFCNGTGQLIWYHRPDHTGPKISDYAISHTHDPGGLAEVLGKSLPVIGVVNKNRTLLMHGRTRIHLDEVDGLGWFMELEVVLTQGEEASIGEAEARQLMEKLNIQKEDLVEGAYLDLISNLDD